MAAEKGVLMGSYAGAIAVLVVLVVVVEAVVVVYECLF